MIDILFLFPKTGEDIGASIAPPFGVLCASSLLNKENYKIKVIDQRTDKNWKNQIKSALKSNPLFVGISTMTGSQIYYALEMAKTVRKNNKDIKIVWGGTHPTIIPQQTLENEYVDIIVRGEGEETCLELAKRIEKNKDYSKLKGINLNPQRKYLDINKLPETPWKIINVKKYISK